MKKCSGCEYLSFGHGKHQHSQYFCTHPNSEKSKHGRDEGKAVVVERCEPGSEELTMKYAPKWCPVNTKKVETNNEKNNNHRI